jgi:hypothetical protein
MLHGYVQYMNEEEKNSKTDSEKKYELASAWSLLLWTELERMIDKSIERDGYNN